MDTGKPPRVAYRFDRFTLDLARGALLAPDGAELPLRPKSFALLRLLVESAGRLLDHDTIMRAVWPGVLVTEGSIAQCVRDIRRALRDEAQRLLRTVPRRGYLFAEVAVVQPEALLGSSAAGGGIGDLDGSAAPVPATPAPHASPERRQLTVLHCGLCGPALLAARRDPEDLQHLLAAFHEHAKPAIAEAGGTVERLLDDGLLVYFGYPRADEHQAERTVRAALRLVETASRIDTGPLGRLHLRVGVATGLAVAGGQPAAPGQPTALGEAIHLAGGLASRAEPGGVLLAAGTRRLVGELFQLRPRGPVALDGADEPVEAWAVEGLSASEGRFDSMHGGRLTGFVGREHELGLLMERWSLARDGEGQVVLLSGGPGIGKSRIVRELRERLEREGANSLRFHCSPYHANSAFYPIIDNFERALHFAPDESPDRKLDKLDALMIDQYGRPREDVRFIAAMLSLPYEARHGAVAMTPQRFKDETLRALVEIVAVVARQSPTALLFEDAQWADPTTLEVMDRLVQRVRTISLLVVITHRPEFSPRWSQHCHVTALALSKLTRPQSAAMVSKLAGGKALPADLLEQILGKTDGVPLFIEELTKSILESADLRDIGGRWEYAGPAGTFAIPLTLRDSLMARLDRVAPARGIAQIGAAIGREFSYELVAAVASYAKPELDQALARLTTAGLAFQQGTPPDAVYTFKHALVRDAAYDSLLKGQRHELHGKIARAIETRFPNVKATEPELLAHHYTEARQPDKAIPLWQKAGNLALGRVALAEAIAHLNRGLALIAALPPSAERDGLELDLRLALGTAWTALRGWAAPEVWDSVHPALGLARALRRTDALLRILPRLKSNVMTTGRVAESLRWATEIMDSAETYHDPDFLICGHRSLANSYLYFGELTKAREHAEQVLSVYTEERHDRLTEILATETKTQALMIASHTSWMLGFPERAVRIGEECESHARRRGHAFNLAYVLTFGATVFNHLGQPDEVLRRAEEADRLGRDNRLPFITEVLVPIHSGVALIRRGQVAEGVASLRAGAKFWEATGGRNSLPYHKSVLAEGMAQLGELDGALCLTEEVIAQVERPGWEERFYHAETLRIRGGILARKGDTDGAERSYAASLAWARHQEAKSFELRAATSYARLLRDRGRVGEARDLLAPVYGWFTEGFGTKDLKEAKALLDELAAARGRSSLAATLGVLASEPGGGRSHRI